MNASFILKKFTLVTFIIFLGGCASIVKAPAHLDNQAKKFKNSLNYSQVYLYRNESFGEAIPMTVTVDGKLAGTTGPYSYFKFTIEPGAHVFTSQGNESVLNINTKKGKLYFIWQRVKMGVFYAGSNLQLVNESQGKKAVLECTLIDSSIGKKP